MASNKKSRTRYRIKEVVAREQTSGSYGGVNYGPRAHLLVDGPTSRLIHVPGHMFYFNRMSGTRYVTGSLFLTRDRVDAMRNTVARFYDARLSKALLARADVRAAVAAEWGEVVASALDAKKTIRVCTTRRRL